MRAEPYKLNNIKELWSTAGWQISLDMRRSETFENSADAILGNNAMIQKHMSANFIRPAKRRLETRRSTEYAKARSWVTQNLTPESDTEKGKGKGKYRGKDSGKKNEIAVCHTFNKGTCTFGEQCRFAHKCSECKRNSHGAVECRSKGSPKATKGNKGGGKGAKGLRKGPRQEYESNAFTLSQ